MANASVRRASPTQQEVCIDLPGEAVRCWRSSDNLKVVLRKHRDVIFDLRLGKGKTYTVEATQSDFYNARDKKLVYARANGHVKFADGERMHLWVTRNFRGALLLKCDNKLMMKIEPNELDRHQYDDEPGSKPAPIIIALGDTHHTEPAGAKKPTLRQTIPPLPRSTSAVMEDECPIVCVMEGALQDAPQNVREHFKNGGRKSGLTDIDPNGVATRNWLWGQVAGAAAYVGDNWNWLRASIDSKTHQGVRLVRARVHLVRGKVRYYFSGYSKFNPAFGPGGHGPGHDRIMSIFAGVGKTKSAFAAVSKGVLGTIKGNALVSFIFTSATAMAEWKSDVSKDGYDLAASLLMGLLKAFIGSAITLAIVAGIIVIVMGGLSASVAVLAVGVVTILVGATVGYFVDLGDKKLGRSVKGDENEDGLSASLAPILRKTGKHIRDSWDYLMNKFPEEYAEIIF